MVPVRLGRHRRVLITGGAGVVASAMVRATPGEVALTVTRRRRSIGVPVGADVSVRTVELTDPVGVDRLIAEVRPDVVVHAAASISDEADVVTASDVVARGAARHGAALLHLSSDAVFAGDAAPYTERDLPDPVHDYGRWKAEAEHLARAAVPDVCITRTSLVVSVDPPDRTVALVLDGRAAQQRASSTCRGGSTTSCAARSGRTTSRTSSGHWWNSHARDGRGSGTCQARRRSRASRSPVGSASRQGWTRS